jgi:CRP-like cAMP-binding protein
VEDGALSRYPVIEAQPGEDIFRQGDPAGAMYLIQEGEIEILRETHGEILSLALLEKGDFFGEVALLEDLPRNATARAVTECQLVKVDSESFERMIRQNPEIAVRMLRKIANRLRVLDERLDEAAKGVLVTAPQDHVEEMDTGSAMLERLVHVETGEVFLLRGGLEISIGRKVTSAKATPDIDLSSVDPRRTVSRRHAVIYRQGGKLFLAEAKASANGTFVNGSRLDPGIPVEIQDGDEICFGLVSTAFELMPTT